MLKTYPSNGKSLTINTGEDSNFQVTTTKNELESLLQNSGSSVIELGDCEKSLKEANNISSVSSLILLKYENKVNSTFQKNVQYEVYNPNNYEKLDLSVCESDINLYIPITLQEESKQLYNEVNQQEYDLLDINSKFYTDVCTPFTTEKDTDILLNDRINYYYNKINREIKCPKNCQLLLYMAENNYLKCKCEIKNEDIKAENADINEITIFDYIYK